MENDNVKDFNIYTDRVELNSVETSDKLSSEAIIIGTTIHSDSDVWKKMEKMDRNEDLEH